MSKSSEVEPQPPASTEEAFGTTLLDPQSPAAMLRYPVGVFDDLWVGQHAFFSFLAYGSITSMSVEVWIPPEALEFSLSLRVEGELECTLTAPPGEIAVLQYPLRADPGMDFTIELVANSERKLPDPDRRYAAYIIRSISLD